ncbi:MAG TPA: MlaD family protein [Thermoanaerobaculia bacterium]|nr:MlaD family protein [Thermoanaerobaculia bacterium]
MTEDGKKAARVGALVLASLIVSAAGIFLVGQQSEMFQRKVEYYSTFPSVSGLYEGNPVQLDGVKVGAIQSVVLPENPGVSGIRVEYTVDRRYRNRIREDSEARIQTIGLLGDKYIEISSGSLDKAVIPEGGQVPSMQASAVETLMQSGQDVMTNLYEISAALKSILARLDRGEGLLGELMSNPETGRTLTDALVETLDSVKEVAGKIEHGEGTLPRLITDRDLAERFVSAVGRIETLLARYEQADGLLPSLMTDQLTKERFDATLASLETAAKDLSTLTGQLKEGKGLVPRLFTDEQYGADVSQKVDDLLGRLDRLAAALESGDGTAAKIIHDPEIYLAIKDIIRGVNESALLRWAIRNRQKAGAEKRLDEQGPP